jgi:rhodanese-related sulfurtransferase/DNA-binding transcriptional ArsR family regulator
MAKPGGRAEKDALFDGFATVAKALASGRRAEIVELLAQGERTVEEIADAIDQSVANTSHHLRTLARAGLVTSRRQGTHVHYRLASDRVYDLLAALRDIAADHLDGLDDLARAYLGDRDQLEAITRSELQRRLAAGEVTVIDVRPRPEFQAGHIRGALSAPLDELDQLLDQLDDDRTVVAYCRGPWCVYADQAVTKLRRAGRDAVRLEDGFPEWARAGGDVARGERARQP